MTQLNVKENNINNKRLSRLQGVTLKILSVVYPHGYAKRQLARIVADGYGAGSILTAGIQGRTPIREEDSPGEIVAKCRDMMKAVNATVGGRDGWVSPKFSVAYSRSIRSLLNQGLVTYQGAPLNGKAIWAVFITEKGIELAKGRKVKINAKFWDAFSKVVARQQEGGK